MGPIPWNHLFSFAAAITALAALVLLIHSLRGDPSLGRRRCRRCWYDMSGAPPGKPLTCPECGWTARHERHLLANRRSWRRIVLAAGLLVLPWAILNASGFRSRGWPALVPTTAFIPFLTSLEAPDDAEWTRLKIGEHKGVAPAKRLYHEFLLHRVAKNRLTEWQQRWIARKLLRDRRRQDGWMRDRSLVWLAGWARRDAAAGGKVGSNLLKAIDKSEQAGSWVP